MPLPVMPAPAVDTTNYQLNEVDRTASLEKPIQPAQDVAAGVNAANAVGSQIQQQVLKDLPSMKAAWVAAGSPPEADPQYFPQTPEGKLAWTTTLQQKIGAGKMADDMAAGKDVSDVMAGGLKSGIVDPNKAATVLEAKQKDAADIAGRDAVAQRANDLKSSEDTWKQDPKNPENQKNVADAAKAYAEAWAARNPQAKGKGQISPDVAVAVLPKYVSDAQTASDEYDAAKKKMDDFNSAREPLSDAETKQLKALQDRPSNKVTASMPWANGKPLSDAEKATLQGLQGRLATRNKAALGKDKTDMDALKEGLENARKNKGNATRARDTFMKGLSAEALNDADVKAIIAGKPAGGGGASTKLTADSSDEDVAAALTAAGKPSSPANIKAAKENPQILDALSGQ
jgi:hypothetical protein